MVLTGSVHLGPLIDAATLAAMATDLPTVLDVRWRLGSPGRPDYDAGHLPGAVFLDLDTDLSGPPGAGGRHPLPDPAALQEVLRAAGVRAGHPVVVYDAGDGQAAARAWWTLRWAGHPEVSVLDGGYAAWLADGHPTMPSRSMPNARDSAMSPVTTDVPDPPPGDIVVRPGGLPVLDAAGAATVAAQGVLIDARIPGRYRGEVEPVDPVAGHIPGAVNVPAAELTGPDGRLLAAAALRDRFTTAGLAEDKRVGAYCGSGVTAAHTILALHVTGRPDAALYVGSWSNWVTDPDRPVAVS
jgi:thiosulfate/3-mercaptopyruvate sulfurtransferase